MSNHLWLAVASLEYAFALLAALHGVRSALAAAPAPGSTFVVNSNADESAACPDAITVPAVVYPLIRAGSDDAVLVGDLDFADDVTTQGAGSAATIL